MARQYKACPTCGPKAPVRLELAPDGQTTRENPVTSMTWTATCETCGYVHPPDSNEQVTDGKGWGKANKAANGGEIVLE
jgi:uncharacterized Zn finger protein